MISVRRKYSLLFVGAVAVANVALPPLGNGAMLHAQTESWAALPVHWYSDPSTAPTRWRASRSYGRSPHSR